VLASPDGTVGVIKKPERIGRNLILVLRRSGNQNPAVVDKVLTSHRSSTDAPTAFVSEGRMEKRRLLLRKGGSKTASSTFTTTTSSGRT